MSSYTDANRKYSLGIAEQTTKSHPWGKGALSRYTPEELVRHAEAQGFSDKYIYKKLGAIYGLLKEHTAKAQAAREGELIALRKAHAKGEFEEDRERMR